MKKSIGNKDQGQSALKKGIKKPSFSIPKLPREREII